MPHDTHESSGEGTAKGPAPEQATTAQGDPVPGTAEGPVADAGFAAQLRQKAAELGAAAFGVTTAEPFYEVGEQLARRREEGLYSTFEPKDIGRRIDPRRLMADAQSVISIAVSYEVEPPFPVEPERNRLAPGRERPDPLRGWISRHAWGLDYHRVVRRKMEALTDFITGAYPDASCMAYVDTGPTPDRAVAARAGVGWIGKNCLLIVPDAGSWVVLGSIITNLKLPPDEPSPPPFQECGDCDLCIRACPTGALLAPGELDPSICLGEVTVMKGSIPPGLREPLGNRIYGCDACQTVCPMNRPGGPGGDNAFIPVSQWDTGPAIDELLQISNREYRERYGDRASGWRGKRTLQRNAIIALGNYREGRAIPVLSRCLTDDPRPIIRGAAAWALGRIGTPEARRLLASRAGVETDGEVRRELQQALADALPAPAESALPGAGAP